MWCTEVAAIDSHGEMKRMHSKKKLAKIVVGLVIVAVLGLAYYYTEGTKDSVENLALVALSQPLSQEQRSALTARLNAYAPDDGRSPVSLVVYTLPGGGSDEAQLQEMMERMNGGQPNLYMLDLTVYERIKDQVTLEPLAARYPGDGAVWSGNFYLLEGTPFLKDSGLENIPGCGIAMQMSDSYAATKDAKAREYYRYQQEILDRVALEK